MTAAQTPFRLAPAKARLPLLPRRGAVLRRRLRRPGAALVPAAEGRFLASLAGGTGFDAACHAAGLDRSAVLLARARHERFAAAWDQVEEARRAAMESMLLDRGDGALRAPPSALSPEAGGFGLDKSTLALLQWVLGALRSGRAGRPAEATSPGRARQAAARGRAGAGDDLPDEEAEAILRAALAQLEAAEAAMGGLGGEGPGD